MKVVADTNVLISGIINPYGKPAKILNLVLERKLVICVDSRIYNEYERVFLHPKFSFPKEHVKTLLNFIRNRAIFVSPPPIKAKLPDISDLPFLEVAISERAPIITGNSKHFKDVEGIKILTPAEFIEWYEKEKI